MERTDVILAAADHYDWEALRPFVESLRASGYTGEVRFFGDLDAGTKARLAEAGVDVSSPLRLRFTWRGTTWRPYNTKTTRLRWHAQPLYRHAIRAVAALARDRRRARERITAALSNVEVARFFWFREFLRARSGQYRNVMLTDVRDVFFLGNPFDFEVGEDAHYFLEVDGATIASQVNNRAWLHGAYGPTALAELGDRPICCSGVTIGSAAAIERYLAAMTGELVKLARQYRGMDQGVHNYLVHHGKAGGRLVTNHEGPVLTVGMVPTPDALALLEARAGEARVVHQYDRHAELSAPLERLTGVSVGPG